MGILDYFPKGMTPRDVQVNLLNQVEQGWQDSDVIVINASVAAGKSAISSTIAEWSAAINGTRNTIVTPTKLLVDQYTSQFPSLNSLRAIDSYRCKRSGRLKCKQQLLKKNLGHYCDGCVLQKAKKDIASGGTGVCNTWIYYANRVYPDVAIFDEAHTLLPFLRELFASHKWQFKTNYPDSLRSYEDLIEWFNQNGYLEMMQDMGFDSSPKYLIEPKMAKYRGQLKHQLRFLPIDISGQRPILWPPNKVKKIVLMSATISRKDIEYMGLDNRRVSYIEAGSPIEARRRPVKYEPVGNLSLDNQPESVPKLASRIRKLLRKHNGEAGLIHATYGLAAKLRPYLKDEPRLVWHSRSNKASQYQKFRRDGAEQGLVMVGSGMYEGLDLAGDSGRWQVITKVPYPSLEDPVTRYLMEQDEEYYHWETIKQLLQASGRICRKLDDYGVTYVVDSSFRRLYTQSQELFPQYWKDSLIGLET